MLSKVWMKGWTRGSAWMAVVLLAAFAITASAQTVPSIVVSSTTTLTPGGLSNVGKVVQDTCGNLYELEASGSLMEIPASGGAAISLVNYGSKWSGDGLLGGLAIDSSNNLYVDNKWNGAVIKIPSSNCVPNPSGTTSVLNGFGWYDPGDIATDAAGDLFVVVQYGSGEIQEETAAGKYVEVLAGGTGNPTALAVDSFGDVFFTAGNGNVYEVPVASYGTSSPTAVISSGLTTALGVSFDSAGNLYVGDSSTGNIYEVPFTTSGSSTTPALQFGSMYLFAAGLPLSNPLTVALNINLDRTSILYSNSNANIYEQVLGVTNIGSVAVLSTGTSTVNVAFNASESPASISFTSGSAFSSTGGTCAGSYTAGQSCTINVNFAPAQPGIATGGITLADASNNVLATAYLFGTGLGAGITLDSGTVTSFGSGFTSPQSIAISPAGGYYIADSGADAVLYFATPSSSPVSIGTGLSAPLGVAVDGAGNVIIADTGHNQIVEVPVINGVLSNSAQTTIVTASVPNGSGGTTPTPIAGAVLSGPAGVTVDGQGNLYIADTGNNRIVYLPYTGSWNVANASVIGSGLSAPLATTVDSSGNLYVADSGSGQIYKLQPPFTGTQQLVAVGYSNPSALATDASGSLFVVDQGANSVLRIPNVSGTLNSNAAIEVGFGVAAPYGVAVDATGNLWVTDATHAAAYEVNRVNTTVSFGDWALSSPSGPLPVQVEDEGNQTLTFSSPFYTATGNTGDFSLGTPTGTEPACADGGTVAIGAVCEMDAIFDPSASGTRTDMLALSSNAQNTAAPQVILTGVGSTASATTTVLVMTSPSGTPSFGQAITLTATVTSSGGTPAGSAQLLVDGLIAGEATLSSGGVATFSLPMGLSGGGHSLQAVYLCSSSCSTFAGSTSVALPLTVSQAATTTTVAITPPYVSPNSTLPGGSNTLTATINFAGVGIPTGTVAFATGTGTPLGSANLVPAAGGLFQASLTTTALTVADTYTFTAAYSGDLNYLSSSGSGGSVIVVSNPLVIVTPSGASLTVNSSTGSSSTITLTPASYGGFNGIVGFQCDPATLPANSACVFSPGQVNVTPNTPSASYPEPPVTMWVAINQPPQTPTASKMIWWIAGPTGLLLLFVRRRMKAVALVSRWNMLLLIAAIGALSAGIMGSIACSKGIQFATPKGTTTVTVYAYADTYVPGTTNNTTSTCTAGSNVYPCSQQTISVSVLVQ